MAVGGGWRHPGKRAKRGPRYFSALRFAARPAPMPKTKTREAMSDGGRKTAKMREILKIAKRRRRRRGVGGAFYGFLIKRGRGCFRLFIKSESGARFPASALSIPRVA